MRRSTRVWRSVSFGIRKVPFAAKNRGKRGSYRTYHDLGGDDVPVFLLAVLAKNQKADLGAKHKAASAKIPPCWATATVQAWRAA